MLRSNKTQKVFLMMILLTLTVSILTASLAAAEVEVAVSDGFVALNGNDAKDYQIPSDMNLVSQETLASNSFAANISVERYQQYLGEAAVFGGQLTIYRDGNGDAVAVIGAHYANVSPQNSVNLTATEARRRAMIQIERGGTWLVELMIHPDTGHYFYIVENQRVDSRWFHWIDAGHGGILNAYNGLAHGTGVGVLGDTKDLTGLTTQNGSQYEMVSANGRITTYDGRNRGDNFLPGVLATDSDDIWDTAGNKSPGQPALVDAHFYANVTDQYLQTVHGFDWLNHYSQGIVSTAHYKRRLNNAYWTGSQMLYGDGDGSSFIELSGELDVVGHELAHGVTEATSNLVYQNESGALNEAFSDIMGTSIEYYDGSGNWTIGEDITPNDNGIRNMANPGEDGDPSHYADRYTGTGDNGGVHINSGIANHWFYLLVNGGQNADPTYASGQNVTGIGLAAAADIAFLGFTALTASADFCDARASTIAVAGGNAANVTDAWDEVGVDDALCNNTGNGDGPVISNVASAKLNGRSFEITWDTDVASDSTVTFTCCGTYNDPAQVTSHRMTFNGQKNVLYEYFVTSENNDGSTTEGPFYHQN